MPQARATSSIVMDVGPTLISIWLHSVTIRSLVSMLMRSNDIYLFVGAKVQKTFKTPKVFLVFVGIMVRNFIKWQK
jgi:hypothetical protein